MVLFCCILGCLLFLICIEFVSVFSCTVLFVSISQVIGCEDRLRNDLYCVDGALNSTPTNQPAATAECGLLMGQTDGRMTPLSNSAVRHARSVSGRSFVYCSRQVS